MVIKYLKDLQESPGFKKMANQGLEESKIIEFENQFNNGVKFPAAFREFLSLAGEYCNLTLDIEDFEWMQETAKETLTEYGYEIKRSFCVVDQLDGCTQFGFFYLDESEDDPYLFNCSPGYVAQGTPLIQPRSVGRFSAYIKDAIRREIISEEYRTY